MQTWLPYPDFEKSAKVLDDARLNAQRNEALIGLRTLQGDFYEKNGWANHPTVKMWRGHEGPLFSYLMEICLEGIRRDVGDEYNNKQDPVFNDDYESVWKRVYCESGPEALDAFDTPGYPEEYPEVAEDIDWFGVPEFHDSHKARLLDKEPEHYLQFNWNVEPDPEIFWPTKNGFNQENQNE